MQVQIISTTGRFSISLQKSRVYQRPASYKAEITKQISSLFQGISIKDPNELIGKPLERDKTLEIRLPDLTNYIVGTKTLERIFKDKKTNKAQIAILDENDIKNIWIYKGDMSQNDYNDLVLLKWDTKKKEFEIEAAHSENEFSVLTDIPFKLLLAQTNNIKRDELRPVIIPPASSNAASTVQTRRDLNAIDVKDKVVKAFTTREVVEDFPSPNELEIITFTPENALEIINTLTRHNSPTHLMNHAQYLGSNRSIRNAFKIHIAEYRQWLKLNMSTSFFAFGLTGSGDAVIMKALELTYSETEIRDAKSRKAAAESRSPQTATPPPSRTTSTIATTRFSPSTNGQDSSHRSNGNAGAPTNGASSKRFSSPASSTTPVVSSKIATGTTSSGKSSTPTKTSSTTGKSPASLGSSKNGSPSPDTHRGRIHLLERSSGEDLLTHVFSNDPAFYDSLRRSMSAEYKDNEKMVFFGQRKDVIGPRNSGERLNWARENPDHCFSQGLGLNERIIDDTIVKKANRIALSEWANQSENGNTKFAISLKILFKKYPDSIKPEDEVKRGKTDANPTHRILDKFTDAEVLTREMATATKQYYLQRAFYPENSNNEKLVLFGQRGDVLSSPHAATRYYRWAKESPNHCLSQGLGLNEKIMDDDIVNPEKREDLYKWSNNETNKETKLGKSLISLFTKHSYSPKPIPNPTHTNPTKKSVLSIMEWSEVSTNPSQFNFPRPEAIPLFIEEMKSPDRSNNNLALQAGMIKTLLNEENIGALVEWILSNPDHNFAKGLLRNNKLCDLHIETEQAERLLEMLEPVSV